MSETVGAPIEEPCFPADEPGDDAHSLAVLSIAPASRVLDVGAGRGVVARLLAQRSCRVVAIELDERSAKAASKWCERVIVSDVESLDIDAELPHASFDVLLLLDVLEHLKDPAATLKKLVPLLVPSGRVVTSIPNVTHAAVRLQLVDGHFTPTDQGLLDRTHLHFFDRATAESLLEEAGLVVTQRLRVRRRLTETEIEVDPTKFAPEVVAAVLADPDAETYQFVFVASSAQQIPYVEQTLASVLQSRLERTQDVLQGAQVYVSHLEDEIKQEREAAEDLRTENAVARTRLSEVEMALSERLTELEVLHRELHHLEADLEIKDAYVLEMRTTFDEEIAAIRNRVSYRIVSGMGERLNSYPTFRRFLLALVRRVLH